IIIKKLRTFQKSGALSIITEYLLQFYRLINPQHTYKSPLVLEILPFGNFIYYTAQISLPVLHFLRMIAGPELISTTAGRWTKQPLIISIEHPLLQQEAMMIK